MTLERFQELDVGEVEDLAKRPELPLKTRELLRELVRLKKSLEPNKGSA